MNYLKHSKKTQKVDIPIFSQHVLGNKRKHKFYWIYQCNIDISIIDVTVLVVN